MGATIQLAGTGYGTKFAYSLVGMNECIAKAYNTSNSSPDLHMVFKFAVHTNKAQLHASGKAHCGSGHTSTTKKTTYAMLCLHHQQQSINQTMFA